MEKKVDQNTRYYIDVDLKTGKILHWDFDDKYTLVQVLTTPHHHRIFLTKGQYNKLVQKNVELHKN